MTLDNVAATNDFATVSKISAERTGYIPGKNYSCELFKDNPSLCKARAPLINIGYATRVLMIRQAICEVMESSTADVVVVSLGSGFDNTFHWLCDNYSQKGVTFIEVDCTQVIERKVRLLQSLYSYGVTSPNPCRYKVQSAFPFAKYTLLALDLTGSLDELLQELSSFHSVTKIWISECVLCYLDPKSSSRVLELAANIQNSHFILYEQLVREPHDAFTQCMKRHFQDNDSPILSSVVVNGPSEQIIRFNNVGFSQVKVSFMHEFLHGDPKLANMMFSLHPFDEWEELDLFMSHYALTLASNASVPLRSSNCVTMDVPYSIMLAPLEEGSKSPNEYTFSSSVKTALGPLMSGGRKSINSVDSALNIGSQVVLQHELLRRYRHQSALFRERYLIVVGGRPQTSSLIVVDILSRNLTHSFNVPSFNRIGHTSVIIDNRLFVFGGFSPTNGQSMPDVYLDLESLLDNKVTYETLDFCFITADSQRLSLPRTRYSCAQLVGPSHVALVAGFSDHSLNDILFLDVVAKKWCPIRISGRKDHLLLKSQCDQDGSLLQSDCNPRVVCFSMGSHQDAPWQLDLTPLWMPAEVPVLAEFTSSRFPYVRRWRLDHHWDREFLLKGVDPKHLVSVHKSTDPGLLFYPEKNFCYHVLPFREFLERLENDREYYYYFRALSQANVRKQRADFWADFPALSKHLPLSMFHIPEGALHSSVLRVSSARNFSLWCHYDVMSNFLLQLRGRKRVVLYPPMDAPFMYLQGSSSVVSPSGSFPLTANAHPLEVFLEPGDMLFIPALWFHHVAVEDEQFSVAVNVFWRDLPEELYPRKELYGNADLPCEHALSYPEPFRSFYLWKAQNIA
jgi:hypothetical protein